MSSTVLEDILANFLFQLSKIILYKNTRNVIGVDQEQTVESVGGSQYLIPERSQAEPEGFLL